jgi:hypothetical protein
MAEIFKRGGDAGFDGYGGVRRLLVTKGKGEEECQGKHENEFAQVPGIN